MSLRTFFVWSAGMSLMVPARSRRASRSRVIVASDGTTVGNSSFDFR